MSDQAAFLNRLKSLFNIDWDMLPELPAADWPAFRDNPVRFLLRANDAQANAIWREVERRQRPTPTAKVVAIGTKHAPGPWEVDTVENEGASRSERFNSYAVFDATGAVLFDSLNSENVMLADDRDGEGGSRWDVVACETLTLASAAPDLLSALKGLLAVCKDSRGIDGYHLNGDTAEWSEFEEVAAAEAALVKAGAQ